MDSTSNKLSLPTDAFGELLRTLNPYLDDVFRQSEFHCFLDLPLELHYKVYEKYVIEENKALVCQKWNGVEDVVQSPASQSENPVPTSPLSHIPRNLVRGPSFHNEQCGVVDVHVTR